MGTKDKNAVYIQGKHCAKDFISKTRSIPGKGQAEACHQTFGARNALLVEDQVINVRF